MPEKMHEIQETIRIQLNYPPEKVNQPVLYRLIRDFGLKLNILKANVEPRTGSFVFLELSGESGAIERALRFLDAEGIGVSAIGLDGVTEWGIQDG
jgi:L-aspartate semialdehyde sulfurtransferase ferredoxin